MRSAEGFSLKAVAPAAVYLIVSLTALLPAGFAQTAAKGNEDPRLKDNEKFYLSQVLDLDRAIRALGFPFIFRLNRYAGLDPKEQIGADERGLEFVRFHERIVLKITGNYNAAFDSSLLTSNERASRVLGEVIVPILQLLPDRFPGSVRFDAYGFEIGYHTIVRSHGSDYEGKELLTMIIDHPDVERYLQGSAAMSRQATLNRSEVYLNGSRFGLALAAPQPLEVSDSGKSPSRHASMGAKADVTAKAADLRAIVPSEPQEPVLAPRLPWLRLQPRSAEAAGQEQAEVHNNSPTTADLEMLQHEFQPQLDELARESEKYHFVSYAPPSFVNVRNKPALQITLRNPRIYDKETTSIYKRAAQSFDLFFAPLLRQFIDRIPDSPEFGAVDVTILNALLPRENGSSEAVEFLFPLKALRQFAAAGITNQDLINQSIVMVNGVRIALNLQQVE